MFNNLSESIRMWTSNDGIPENITSWTQYYNESLDTLWDSHEIFETFKRDLITLNQPNTIVLICLYVPVFLTAIIGNLTVLIVIIPNRRMWSVTNNFLLNLAIADLLGKLLNLYRVKRRNNHDMYINIKVSLFHITNNLHTAHKTFTVIKWKQKIPHCRNNSKIKYKNVRKRKN